MKNTVTPYQLCTPCQLRTSISSNTELKVCDCCHLNQPSYDNCPNCGKYVCIECSYWFNYHCLKCSLDEAHKKQTPLQKFFILLMCIRPLCPNCIASCPGYNVETVYKQINILKHDPEVFQYIKDN